MARYCVLTVVNNNDMYICNFPVIVAWGVKKSSTLNKAFTLLNLLTLSTVVVSGFFLGKY